MGARVEKEAEAVAVRGGRAGRCPEPLGEQLEAPVGPRGELVVQLVWQPVGGGKAGAELVGRLGPPLAARQPRALRPLPPAQVHDVAPLAGVAEELRRAGESHEVRQVLPDEGPPVLVPGLARRRMGH